MSLSIFSLSFYQFYNHSCSCCKDLISFVNGSTHLRIEEQLIQDSSHWARTPAGPKAPVIAATFQSGDSMYSFLIMFKMSVFIRSTSRSKIALINPYWTISLTISGQESFFYVRINETPSKVIFILKGGFLSDFMLSNYFLSSPKTAF